MNGKKRTIGVWCTLVDLGFYVFQVKDIDGISIRELIMRKALEM
jgi:hypothetical protein